jgi:enoyl-[acyl-carrier protein] reductase I
VTDAPQKTAVILGLANKRSIAWTIAQKLSAADWRLAISYMNERLGLESKDLIEELPNAAGFMCDVTKDEEIARLYDELQSRYGVLHGLVHSIGFAPPDELKHPFVNTNREGFRIAPATRVYSLLAVSPGGAPLMTEGASTLTYRLGLAVPITTMGVAAAPATVRYPARSGPVKHSRERYLRGPKIAGGRGTPTATC